MQKDHYSISITIPFYEGEELIRNCVKSILDNTRPVRRIYIVDNSPQAAAFDTSLGPFAGNPLIEIIRTQAGIGFGRACNIGVYRGIAAGDDVCVILNQDAVLDQRCLEYLITPFTLDPRIFAVVPVSLTYDLHSFNHKTLVNYIYPVENLVSDCFTGRLQPFYPLNYDQANGACVAFRTHHIQMVGLFDPVYWLYGEDLELFQRAQKSYQLKTVLAPQARIGHRHSNFSLTGKESDRIEVLTRHGRQIAQIKDPEKSFPAALFTAIIRNLRPYWRAIINGKFAQIGRYLASDVKLAGKLPEIRRSRDDKYLQQRIERFLRSDPTSRPG